MIWLQEGSESMLRREAKTSEEKECRTQDVCFRGIGTNSNLTLERVPASSVTILM